MDRHRKIRGALALGAALVFLSFNFSIAFVLTNWIYGLIGQTPSPLVVQIVNSIVGITFAMLTIGLFARAFRSRIVEGESRLYGPIIEALERIAKGDFSVRVDSEQTMDRQGSHVMENLVKSVNRMAVELDQMESLRQEFVSNVSHELQSPLTSIHGFAQALRSDNLSHEDRQHYLTIIETETTRLSRLTDNLLRLASLESDQVKFDPKPYRLDKQIRNLILACEPQWTAKTLAMDVALDPVEVTADEDLLTQVWMNLLHNSIKFIHT